MSKLTGASIDMQPAFCANCVEDKEELEYVMWRASGRMVWICTPCRVDIIKKVFIDLTVKL